MKFFLYLPLFFAFICVEMTAEEYVGVDFVEEKAVRYEVAVSVYVSYPSPGYGEWMNPGCGFMTTHGVRFNKIDFFLGASVGVDLQIPWFPVPALVAGIQPKYYFVDRSKTEFFVLVEGGYIIDGYGSDAGYVMPGIGVGFKLKRNQRIDLSLDVRTVIGDYVSADRPVVAYPHLAVGYRF